MPSFRSKGAAIVLCFVVGTSSLCLGQAESKRLAQSFTSLASKAEVARKANRLDEAERLYRQGTKLKPSWSEGWWSLGTILYDQNHFQEAARAFERLSALNPKNGTARLFLGLCQFQLDQDDASLNNIQKARELGILNDPQLRNVAVYHEALLHLRKSRFETALQVLHFLNRQGVHSSDVKLALGMAMLRMTPTELSKQGSDERAIVLRIGESQDLAASKKFDEAKSAYASVVQQTPNFPGIHYAFGRFLLDAHEVDAAVSEFHKEISNNPNNVVARLQIAATKYRTDSASGIPFAEEAVKLDPTYPFGHYLLGLLYADVGDAVRAIPELEVARKAFPNESKVYFALGNAYSKVGRKADAAAARKKFLALQDSQTQQNPEAVVASGTSVSEQEQQTSTR